MTENLKILMVDDHPLILEGYRSKLKESFNQSELELIIETARDCDEAHHKIESSLVDKRYDVIFLDINLPPSQDKRFLSGEDLGQEIRKISPSTLLIVLTMYSENRRLMSILKNLDPDAFLIKSDVTPQEFFEAFEKVCDGQCHYSQSITNVMRKQLTTNIVLKEEDRKILYYLSEGIRTKDLVDKVLLSLPSIEKRKKMMKELFEVEKEGDLALINRAKKLGFL